jgi:hypothetical protein
MKFFKNDSWNNAHKAVASLAGVLLCIDMLPAAATMKDNPAVPAVLSLGAQILFVLFIYYALTWIRKD